jgi:hypothetical protein
MTAAARWSANIACLSPQSAPRKGLKNEKPIQWEQQMKIIDSSIKKTALAFCVIAAVLAAGCASPSTEPEAATNPDFAIATTEYSDLAVKSLTAYAQLDFDAWAATMSDDVEFYFPDGDSGTRTSVIGKPAVLEWFKNWKATSGIQSMSYLNHVDIPVISKAPNPYTGLMGTSVLSYFSNEMVFSGATVRIRMNFVMYFDSAKLINRVYTYYDRAGLIEATGKNVLKK